MTFEEDFPSLQNTKPYRDFVYLVDKDALVIDKYYFSEEIEKHCLDKQRVKETRDLIISDLKKSLAGVDGQIIEPIMRRFKELNIK